MDLGAVRRAKSRRLTGRLNLRFLKDDVRAAADLASKARRAADMTIS